MTSTTTSRVLVISHDIIGPRMAGPGIRYLNLARELAKEFSVVLAAPVGSDLSAQEAFEALIYADATDEALRLIVPGVDVAILPSVWAYNLIPGLPESVRVVIDGYDPVLIEAISLGMEDTGPLLARLTQAYVVGDFFVCASERQRDWWIGLLEAMGRINPYTVGDDHSLRRLIATVPYGLPSIPSTEPRPVIREQWPGLGANDRILLWGGGLWSWLDPLSAVRAMAKVCTQRADVSLVFPGTKHPNPAMQGITTHAEAARELAASLGLLDRHVFFGDWVPYSLWHDVLLESDVALTLHQDTLESRLAFRSRVLDYIWAGLPTIATRGDATSDVISQYGLGRVVDFGDVNGIAQGILELLDLEPDAWDARFAAARTRLVWEQTVKPLVAYCRDPYMAPDKAAGAVGNPFYLSRIAALQAALDDVGGSPLDSVRVCWCYIKKHVVSLLFG